MNKEKKNKLFGIVLGVVVVAVLVGGFLYSRTLKGPSVVINGVELSTGATVQEIIDAGFQIRLSGSSSDNLNIEKQQQIPGESYTSTRYYIYVENDFGWWDCTDVSFSVYNASVNSVDFAKSKVYAYYYYAKSANYPCDVIINGGDFAGMGPEEAIAAFEEAGIKFEAEEKEEFLAGDSLSLYGKMDGFTYILTQDYERTTIEWVEVRRKV